MNVQKCALSSTLFLSISFFSLVALADLYHVPPGSADGPFGGGVPPDACFRAGVIGRTAEDAARKAVAANNAVTGTICSSTCRNPQGFVSASESSYVVRSLCTGSFYSAAIVRILDPKNNGQPPCGLSTAHPVNVETGNKYFREVDISFSSESPIKFVRTFNSKSVELGRVGRRWSSSYSQKIVETPDTATVFRPDGRQYFFTSINGEMVSDADVLARLERHVSPDGLVTIGWTYLSQGQGIETFDEAGRLISILYESGSEVSLSYGATGRLEQVVDQLGLALTFEYDVIGRIVAINDNAGRSWHYLYDTLGNLIQVEKPDLTKRIYHHEDARFPHAITGVTDERGIRYGSVEYDELENVRYSGIAEGVEGITVSYLSDGARTLQDSLGRERTVQSESLLGKRLPKSVSGSCGVCTGN